MKGILFKEAMFKATVEGKKTQTRRIIKPQQPANFELLKSVSGNYTLLKNRSRYKIGEIIYLKEPFIECNNSIFYKYLTVNAKQQTGWQNKLFMPEKYARYFIKIKDVRVERLQDIDINSIIEEGIVPVKTKGMFAEDEFYEIMSEKYITLWETINGKNSWNENPFVWVYEYELSALKNKG